jgi:Flp pilus assembly protein TadD
MTARTSSRRDRIHAGRKPRRGPDAAGPPVPERIGPSWLAIALIFIAGAAAYANGFSSPFIFDDELAIERNPELHQWPDVRRILRSAPPESPLAGRPLVSLTFALNSAVTGTGIRGFRVVNLAIHVACAVLMFGIVRRTVGLTRLAGSATTIALAGSLLWVVHPLASETVNYLTQRTESTMAFFALATLYASVRAHSSPRRRWWLAAAGAACALGMACKETMVVVPVLVALYDRVFIFPSLRAAARARAGFYALLAGAWLVLAALMSSAPRTIGSGFSSTHASPWDYLLAQTTMISRYLWLTVWPRDLVLYYGWAEPVTLGAVWPYAILVTTLALATLAALSRAPAVGFLGVWVFITLSPTSSIVPIGSEVGAERRMYLPLAALMVLLVLAARWLWGLTAPRLPPAAVRHGYRVAMVALAAAVTASAWRTQARTREYSSALTMARTVYERWPSAGAAHMLGTELIEAGYPDEGLSYLRQAAPRLPPARLDLGVQLFKAGRFGEAIEHLRAFIALEPNLTSTRSAELLVAQALTIEQRNGEAIDLLRELRRRQPDRGEVIGLLADAYFAQGAHEDAMRAYRDFLTLNPDHPDALANLGVLYAAAGRLDDAIAQFRRAVRIRPDDFQATVNLAQALLDRGRSEDVDEAAGLAASLAAGAPTEARARSLLGLAFERQGRLADARAAYEQALALEPGHAPAREGLERVRR